MASNGENVSIYDVIMKPMVFTRLTRNIPDSAPARSHLQSHGTTILHLRRRWVLSNELLLMGFNEIPEVDSPGAVTIYHIHRKPDLNTTYAKYRSPITFVLVVLKICTEHGGHTALLGAKFLKGVTHALYVVDKGNFARFASKGYHTLQPSQFIIGLPGMKVCQSN